MHAGSQFDPQKVIARLSYEHEAVQQMGFDPTTAKSLCIGFESKGLMKGKVAFALRDSSGRIVAFMGLDVGTQIKLPKTIL